MLDRLIRFLFVTTWRREPTTRRVVKYGLILTLVWGVVFGLIDSELLTVGNWLDALLAGLVWASLILGLRWLDVWARRRLGLPQPDLPREPA